jgi:hypothetical protein
MRTASGVRRLVIMLAAVGLPLAAASVAQAAEARPAINLGLTVGSVAVPLPNGFVACGDPGNGWVLEANGTKLRPPSDPTSVGSTLRLTLAKSTADCSKSSEALTVTALGKLPVVERKSVEIDVDQGRVEVYGAGLDGSALWWRSAAETGHDVCIAPATQGNQQHCSFNVSRSLGADPAKFVLYLLPPGALSATGLFDAAGRPIAPDSLVVLPTRIVIDRVWPAEEVADLSSGEALITLPHGEAVAAVDCDRGLCSLESGMVSIRAARDTPQGANVRLQMRPRVFVRQAQALLDRVSHTVDFVYCPLTGISLGPFRDVDAANLILKLDERCVSIADSLSWSVNGTPAPIVASMPDGNNLLIALGVDHVGSSKLNVIGYRGKAGADVVAVETLTAVPAPRVQSKITLEGLGEIGFVPTNRAARLSATAPKLRGRLVPLSYEGIYSVEEDKNGYRIRGVPDTDGFVSLRFAVRDPTLPGDFARLNLAVFEAPVQRELKAVHIPAPVAVGSGTRRPIVELLCNDSNGKLRAIAPGTTPHLPFANRDSCRLILHRSRILVEEGEQRLDVRVDVRSASGANRSDGELHQRLVVRHGSDPIVLWLGGVEAQFDKMTVRVTHIVDEMQYERESSERLEIPAATYSVVFENTRMRFYATAAIPTSLFRFSNEPNGVGNGALTLNLGVLSRLTWVTREGSDGLFGAEAGIMGMGLSNQNTRQLNLVAGFGMAVPLGNTRQISQAAINLHAWVAYRPGRDSTPSYDALGNPVGLVELSNWSFVFGPSVTFGNVGLDL